MPFHARHARGDERRPDGGSPRTSLPPASDQMAILRPPQAHQLLPPTPPASALRAASTSILLVGRNQKTKELTEMSAQHDDLHPFLPSC